MRKEKPGGPTNEEHDEELGPCGESTQIFVVDQIEEHGGMHFRSGHLLAMPARERSSELIGFISDVKRFWFATDENDFVSEKIGTGSTREFVTDLFDFVSAVILDPPSLWVGRKLFVEKRLSGGVCEKVC